MGENFRRGETTSTQKYIKMQELNYSNKFNYLSTQHMIQPVDQSLEQTVP